MCYCKIYRQNHTEINKSINLCHSDGENLPFILHLLTFGDGGPLNRLSRVVAVLNYFEYATRYSAIRPLKVVGQCPKYPTERFHCKK